MSKPDKATIALWKKNAKDKNIGLTVREWYIEKLREAGVKI